MRARFDCVNPTENREASFSLPNDPEAEFLHENKSLAYSLRAQICCKLKKISDFSMNVKGE